MQALAFGLWMANAALDTSGQLAFKAAAGTPEGIDGIAHWKHMAVRPWLWFGIVCFVVQFLVWIAFLSLLPLARGVLLGSIDIILIMLAGRVMFGEKLSGLRVAGITLITLGVALVGAA